MTPITRKNVDELLDQGKLYTAMQNGRWWRMRRNGQTKRWKRDSSRIYIPYKIGFRECNSITENNFHDVYDGALSPDYFRHIDDIPVGD